jgi:hypothetical protein
LDDRLYSVFSRVDSIVRYPDVVRKMARANMRVVFIGIEAATQAALDRMNKKTRIEDIHRACEILDSNGILVWAGNIVGNLDDRREDVEALIRINKKLPVDIADFTVITPWPGTELYRHAYANGLIENLDFSEYCECEPHMHTAHLSSMEIMELQIKAYIKFYGFWPMLRRAGRWYRNKEKRWMLERDQKGYRSFWNFRTKSAFYFWRTYKEVVGKTHNTKIRRYSPLVSTPVLYSIGAGVGAALITLLLTILLARFFGDYPSRGPAFVMADLLFSAVFVAFTIALVATWLAVRSYRHGWIFSVRQRKPARDTWTLADRSLRNALVYSAAAFALTAALIAVVSLAWSSSQLTYGAKEALVTAIAFLTALPVSYLSVRSVRNGEIARG